MNSRGRVNPLGWSCVSKCVFEKEVLCVSSSCFRWQPLSRYKFRLGLLTASDAECPAQEAAASDARGLILQQPDGDRRVRRPWPGSVARMSPASMIIKVDERNGGSTDFFVGYEEIAPGNAIPAHLHSEYDEILIVHEGKGLARLGSEERAVTAGALIYIPPNTRVSFKNTGSRL